MKEGGRGGERERGLEGRGEREGEGGRGRERKRERERERERERGEGVEREQELVIAYLVSYDSSSILLQYPNSVETVAPYNHTFVCPMLS